jgi:hypothetical protein
MKSLRRNYCTKIKPSAITLTMFNNIKSVGQIGLCFIVLRPDKSEAYWCVKQIKRVKIDYFSDYAQICSAYCQKEKVPFIPGIKRNDSVTIMHRQILAVYSTFVNEDKEKKIELLNYQRKHSS